MIWQDIVITLVNIVFSLSVIPQALLGFRHKKGVMTHWTTVPTFLGCFFMAFAFLTLDLYFSAATTLMTGVFWAVLFVQRMWYV